MRALRTIDRAPVAPRARSSSRASSRNRRAGTTKAATAVMASEDGPRTWDGSTPPVIVNNVPGTWAHDTVSRRLREDILARVFRDNASVIEGEAEINLRQLEDELSTASTSVIKHIADDGGPDCETWRELLEPWVGISWLDAPWLIVEFYFYRRILSAIGYFDESSPTFLHDPFAVDKMNGLRAGMPAAEALAKKANAFAKRAKGRSDRADLADELRLFVMVALWGNRMDLSIWPESDEGGNRASEAFTEALQAGEKYLLWDDSKIVASALAEGMRDVSIVVDNAGFELTCDLALADALVVSGVGRVILRVKAHPVFVSDAMDKDCRDTIDAMTASADDETAAMGRRWASHLASGKWAIVPDFAWCQPQPFWALPKDTRDELKSSDLVVIKGDANYRRLLNDCLWELSTPFADVSSYFPAPLLALRSLKAELGCGIPMDRVAAVENEKDWMVTGKYGVVQYNARPARQYRVSSQIDGCKTFAGRDLPPVERLSLKKVLVALANASEELADALAVAPMRSSTLLGSVGGAKNASGDSQQKLDVVANDIFKQHLAECGGVRYYASEEEATPACLNASGKFVVCIDPLDGSRNIACNVPVGSIFGVYRVREDEDAVTNATQAGSEQVAAGYAHYSGATTLVLACGDDGPAIEYTLHEGNFEVANARMSCPPRGQVYSLNDARFDDWPEGLKEYVTDVRNGRGDTKKQYSARYICSLVGDFHRTLIYGGWAGNPRPHLRVVYEAAPLAFVARAAGAASSDGLVDVLTKKPAELHERSPLFLGSTEDIAELVRRGDVRQDDSKTYAV